MVGRLSASERRLGVPMTKNRYGDDVLKVRTTVEVGPNFWGMLISIFVAGVGAGIAMGTAIVELLT